MMYYIIASFLLIGISSAGTAHNDVLFFPPVLDVHRDSTGYVQAMIHFTSITGDTIQVTGIEGSCRCATASVQRPIAYDTLAGKIYLAINAKHFTDSVNYLDYTIRHTGPHSPSTFRVIVHVK